MAQGFAQSFKSGLTANDATAMEPPGIIRYTDNNVFKYVKFSGTVAAAVGDPVEYVATDTSLQTVDPTFAATNVPAGVAMAAAASGSVSYGWIQIGGVASVNGCTTTAGQEVKISATKTVAVKAAATDPTFGIAVNTVSAAVGIIQLVCGN